MANPWSSTGWQGPDDGDEPRKSSVHPAIWVLSGVFLLVFFGGAFLSIDKSKMPAQSTPTGAARQFGTMDADGTYVVGKDIAPGTYRSTPTLANGYPFCTWKRLRGFSGELADSIAIDNQPGQTIVTIAPTDVAFESISCQPWEKIS
ncbi:hypothetical protein [Mycolicibacterium llatzerense]|uniref:hypothetical protein n=1 Tax=Mycolicibacterium llatzerense TaxID=280871 RepID=UPI0021B5A211|nr:hypothetical protein [Mycolicibacterium llatzerense]MCT7364036.1 hypothetical protein [Mycolicibacterium llatzerense]